MRMLRSSEVREIFGGYSSVQLEHIMKQPDFPKPVRAYEGARFLLWFEDEIKEYLEKLRSRREGDAA
jgi:predicted DNA-binding transcriptional regulator AlpA